MSGLLSILFVALLIGLLALACRAYETMKQGPAKTLVFGIGAAALFAVPGIFMPGWSLPTLVDAMQLSRVDLVAVPCTPRRDLSYVTNREGCASGEDCYRPIVACEYRFGGSSHAVDSRFAPLPRTTRENAYRLIRSFGPGTAFVHPRHPEMATLSRDIRWGAIIVNVIFNVLFGGLGLLFFVLFCRRSCNISYVGTNHRAPIIAPHQRRVR